MISTVLDILNTPSLSSTILSSLKGATVENLNTFAPTTASKPSPWALLRSSMFESIRLAGTVTGPARTIVSRNPLPLVSNPNIHLPPGQIATLSSWYTHRQEFNYTDATTFKYDRYVSLPSITHPAKLTCFQIRTQRSRHRLPSLDYLGPQRAPYLPWALVRTGGHMHPSEGVAREV